MDVREWLGRLILAGFGVLVALLLAELVARITWKAPEAPPPAPVDHAGLPEIEDATKLVRPGVRGVHRGVVYEMNRYGFRGPEVSRRKPPDSFRIVLVGDSVAMGYGVSWEDSYAARVERALNQRDDGPRTEVLNLGVPGYSARSVLDRLVELGVPFRPDLVVYGFTLNDIESPAYRHSAKPGREVAATRDRSSPSYLWRVLVPRYQSLLDLVAPPPGSYLHELNENYFENPRAVEVLERVFDGLFATAADVLDACALVFVHTRLYYLGTLHPFVRHYEMVERTALVSGLHVAQSLPHFLGEDAQSLWVGPFDSHPNARGHEILAEALLDALDALPARCLAPRDGRGAARGPSTRAKWGSGTEG